MHKQFPVRKKIFAVNLQAMFNNFDIYQTSVIRTNAEHKQYACIQ